MTDERGLITRVATGLRYIVSGETPADWFGPSKPLPPMAPPEVAGRGFDFPVGVNLRIAPRPDESVSFADLRALADACDLLRLILETRKDQVSRFDWTIRRRDGGKTGDPRIAAVTRFLRYPDREHGFEAWLRMLLEDLLVIDAPALYVRRDAAGGVYALEAIDGATVKRVLDARGRTPAPPEPAYQQILKGLPAVDYTTDELIYRPRNPRPHKIYGYSPVEQVIMTVNVALRRQAAQLAYYTEGNVPEAMIGVPESWSPDQIRRFQEYWDSLLEGNVAARRHAKFVPGGMKPTFTREPMLKDEYDEWLARVICFAFSVAPTPFVRDANRATAQTTQAAALSEGLAPLQRWVKGLLDEVIERHLGYADLEFSWSEEDAQDPAAAAQIANIYVSAGIKSVDEVRAELGLPPAGKGAAGVAKYSADQPRMPAGQPGGGQWIGSEAAGAAAHRTRLDEAPRFDVTDAGNIATDATINVSYRPRGVEVAEGKDADAKPELSNAAKKAGIDETPPDYKLDRVTPEDWVNFNNAVAAVPGITAAEQFTFAENFAAEGGTTPDQSVKPATVAGITNATLQAAKNAGVAGLESAKTPADLTDPQRAAVYRYFYDDALERVGKSAALNDIGDRYTAAAVGDTLFRHGATGGAELIRKALSNVYDSIPQDKRVALGLADTFKGQSGRLAPSTFETLQKIVAGGYGEVFRDELAKQRDSNSRYNEPARSEHFRFRGNGS